MSNGRDRKIRISRVAAEPGAYVATFTAPVLGATYAVVFSESVTGAIALHRFADMIAGHYGGRITLQIPDELRRMLYFAVVVLIQMGIFSTRWNVVIGGQLFSKSLRGLTVYKMELLGLEGLFTSVGLLILPLVILFVLIKIMPPWPESEMDLPVVEGAQEGVRA